MADDDREPWITATLDAAARDWDARQASGYGLRRQDVPPWSFAARAFEEADHG